jgi:hypothetical protein
MNRQPTLQIFASLLTLYMGSAPAQSLENAFTQGSSLGRAGNGPAFGQIGNGAAQSLVPHFSSKPPQSAHFGTAGIGTPAAAAANACANERDGTTFDGQACNAIQFSQANPSRRPRFSIAPTDPLLTRARAISGQPESLAGQLTGTYSDCSVEATRGPDVFETAQCHEYRTTEVLHCDKVLTVTAVQAPGCSDGQFLTRVTADPCPDCVDYIAFDFTCGVDSYRMHAFSINRRNGQIYRDLGTQIVPGTLNTQIPKSPGPTRIDGFYCYQTYYSQSCSGTNCSIGAWFANPCQRTSFQGLSTFTMPTRVSFTDAWDNQCAALEARAR